MALWFGSLFVLILAVYIAYQERYHRGNDSVRMDLLAVALMFYLAGHITTTAFNVPHNDHIQTLDLHQLFKEQFYPKKGATLKIHGTFGMSFAWLPNSSHAAICS